MSTKTLSFEKTRGTKTFHLPFQRNAELGPELTIMVRRDDDGTYSAGLAVCSPDDQFVKRTGRRIAFHRLEGCPFQAQSARELVEKIDEHLDELTHRRVGMLSVPTIQDVLDLADQLDGMFDRLEKNRRALENSDPHRELYIDEGGGC